MHIFTAEYEKALKHAKKAEETDNVMTEKEGERRKKTPKRYIQASEADGE